MNVQALSDLLTLAKSRPIGEIQGDFKTCLIFGHSGLIKGPIGYWRDNIGSVANKLGISSKQAETLCGGRTLLDKIELLEELLKDVFIPTHLTPVNNPVKILCEAEGYCVVKNAAGVIYGHPKKMLSEIPKIKLGDTISGKVVEITPEGKYVVEVSE